MPYLQNLADSEKNNAKVEFFYRAREIGWKSNAIAAFFCISAKQSMQLSGKLMLNRKNLADLLALYG